MNYDIKLIAMDLDGTLLASDKSLSGNNINALREASEKGIFIVPSTGRSFTGMPDEVRALEFIRYAVTINGAHVHSVYGNESIFDADIPLSQGLELASLADELGLAWDVYIDGGSFMDKDHMDDLESFVSDAAFCRTIRQFRKRTDGNTAYIKEHAKAIQKINLYSEDHQLLQRIKGDLMSRYDNLSVTSSIPDNIEINNIHANKGEALLSLAAHLGFSAENIMSFGDGGNDRSMIEAAGLGVAMKNAVPELLSCADYVTLSNDDDGLAYAIRKFAL